MENLKTLTDDQLVKLYVQNHNEAFDELLNRYKDKLFSFIIFNVRDEDRANDVFQETFVRAIVTMRQGRYTANGKFYAWIARIARNLIIDLFRNIKTESTLSNDEGDIDLLNDTSIAEQSFEETLIVEQTLREAKQLMEQLPYAQREVVFMRCYQDLSFKEIAEATGVSINTALGRMHYAVLNMRRMAAEQGMALAAC